MAGFKLATPKVYLQPLACHSDLKFYIKLGISLTLLRYHFYDFINTS